MLLLLLGTQFVVNSKLYAETSEEKVYLDPIYTTNLIATIQYCTLNRKEDKKKLTLLNNINLKEKEKSSILLKQLDLCFENTDMHKQQSAEYKAEYIKTVEELKKAKQMPWYSFDLKSVITGASITAFFFALLQK